MSSPSVDEVSKSVFPRLVQATQAANALPAEDYAYYTTFPAFRGKMQQAAQRLLKLFQKALETADPQAPRIEQDNIGDVTDKFDGVEQVLDGILNKVDLNLDEASGKRKIDTLAPKVQATTGTVTGSSGTLDYRVIHASNILRPQLKFEVKPDNSDEAFRSPITHKPNARTPLPEVYLRPRASSSPVAAQTADEDDSAIAAHAHALGVKVADTAAFPHPYEFELRNIEYRPDQLQPRKEQLYKPLKDTPCTWVETEDALRTVVDRLRGETEIAIDLENHSYRSYLGFLCLMQVSTRTEDFLIDMLALRPHMHLMNDVTTNPDIVKVLHGSDSDILWLQRDCGIYVVNLFDTGQASRVLDYRSFSLAYLLKFYCTVNADKKYQLADWRIRPLPNEMTRYAREDTHYLLYIYDRMVNELIGRGNATNNLLQAVLNRSRELCLMQYTKTAFATSSWEALYNKSSRQLSPVQQRVFAALFAWRDKLARQEDESPRYVMPNHILSHIAEVMPGSATDLIACCNPVPPLVRRQAQELAALIGSARQEATSTQKAAPTDDPPIPPSPGPEPRILSPAATPDAKTIGREAPSPVLTTDQLYRTAGWLERTGMLGTPGEEAGAERRPAARTAMLHPTNVGGADDQDDTRALLQPALAFDSGDEDEEEDSEDSAVKRAQKVYEELAKPRTISQAKIEDAALDTERAFLADPPTREPQTVKEIYYLSNMNRKRNKEKKKLRDESAPGEGDEGAEDDAEDGSGSDDEEEEGTKKKSKAQSDADTEDAEAFMTKIGWIKPGKPLRGDEGDRTGKAGASFTPFDYNNAPEGRKDRNKQGGGFDPYANGIQGKFKKPGGSDRGGRGAGAGGADSGLRAQRKGRGRSFTFQAPRGGGGARGGGGGRGRGR